MPMVSFGDLAQSHLLRRHTTDTKTNLARLSQELATGRSADTPRHVAGDIGPFLALDSSLARLQGYGAITRELGLFAEAMQSSLGTIATQSLDAANALIAASGTSATTHIATAAVAARSALQSTISALNTRFGDRSLFAGTRTDSPAMADADTLLAALETASQGAVTVAAVESAIDTWFAAPTGFAAVMYQGGAALAPVPLAAGEEAALDITARDPALQETLKGLAMAAMIDRGAFSGQHDLRRDIAQRAGEHLLASETDRAYLAARLGATQAQIDGAQSRNAAEAASLEIARTDLVAVDPYETATRLQDAETQLQMIYTLTARISRLSLADYL